MDKLKEKILSINFKKAARVYIVATVLLVIAGSLAAFLSLQVQIKEAASLYHNHEITSAQLIQNETGDAKVYESHGSDWDSLEKQLTPVGAGAKAVLAADGLTGVLIAASYWLLIALWLYQASAKAKMHSLLWFTAGLAGNLFTVIAFLIIRGFIRIRCPQCRSWQHRYSYCSKCGAQLAAECPFCGCSADTLDIYCSSCGQKLTADMN